MHASLSRRAIVAAGLFAGLVASGVESQGAIANFGPAAQYTVFSADGTVTVMSSGNTRVFGDMGVGPGGSLDFSGGGQISGKLVHDPSTPINLSGGSTAMGGIHQAFFAAPASTVLSAAASIASLAPTQTVASIAGGASFNGNGGTNVIKVTGDINVSSSTITINGGVNDIFVFNVIGKATFSGGTNIVIQGGATAANVLWNFVGSGGDINSNGNSNLYGTLVATDRKIIISGGNHFGQILTVGNKLTLQSGPKINYVPFVPAPGTAGVLGLGALLAARRRRSA